MNQRATRRSARVSLPTLFPASVHLVLHLPTNSYGCAAVDGLRGLACFSDAARALEFAGQMPTCGNLVVEMSRADARMVAAASRVRALILADDADRPIVRPLERRRKI